jgi:hypothetical protein
MLERFFCNPPVVLQLVAAPCSQAQVFTGLFDLYREAVAACLPCR